MCIRDSSIGNHTYHHVDVSMSSAKKIGEEISWTNGLIITTTGAVPRWFRPPMGSIDDQAYTEASKQGLSTVLWTVDPGDWPVSYTHLRAHETRHDLVCRLLLEK